MYDTLFRLSPNKIVTKDNFLICENATLAGTGFRKYKSTETDGVRPDKNGFVTLYRDKAVFNDDAIASLEGKPVTLNHPPEMWVTPENWKKYAVGHVQNVRLGEGDQDGFLVGDLVISDPETIEIIKQKILEELSCGFGSSVDDMGGGLGIERDFIGNHVALVDTARSADCRLNDSLPKGVKSMGIFSKKQDEETDLSSIMSVLQEIQARLTALEEAQNQSEAPKVDEKKEEEEKTEAVMEAGAEAAGEPVAETVEATETTVEDEEKKKDEAPEPVPSDSPAPITVEAIAEAVAKILKESFNISEKAEEDALLDSAVKNDCADIAPSVPSDSKNLLTEALKEFSRTDFGASIIKANGGIKNDSASNIRLVKTCAIAKRELAKQGTSQISVKNDQKARQSFSEKVAQYWK